MKFVRNMEVINLTPLRGRKGEKRMKWKVEEDETSGALWVANSVGVTICDLYYKTEDGEIVQFDKGHEYARLIAKAPNQQALIEELVDWIKDAIKAHESGMPELLGIMSRKGEALIIKASNPEG